MITVGSVYFRNDYERILEPYIIIITDIDGTMITFRRLDNRATHVTTGMYIADVPVHFDEVL